MPDTAATICALATAPGRAGVAVIRISGPAAFAIALCLMTSLPEPGQYGLRTLRAGARRLDQALVLTFAAPRSFTGEDVVELHCHGSVAVVDAILEVLVEAGARIAEPGEFTRRALEAGRLTLDEVEGLADLLAAETAQQLDQAHRVASGAAREVAETLRGHVLRALALVTAAIDFADEEVPEDVGPMAQREIRAAAAIIAREIAGSYVAERVKTGFEVAIVGRPNAGKSTLLNAIVRREAALVSSRPGTTRDVIEARSDLRGLPVLWLDTAGLRDTSDEVEKMGVDRAIDRARGADLRIVLLASRGETRPDVIVPGDLVLVGKSDTQDGDVSGLTGDGLAELIDMVYGALRDRVATVGGATRLRHRAALQMAERDLAEASAELDGNRLEFAAERLRAATAALDALAGRMGIEDVLGEVFSTFCIGK